MNCRHTRTSTVRCVTCWEPPPEERKLPGPALSSTPSTMPRDWLPWLVWSGLRRCYSPRRTSTSSLPEKDENLVSRKRYLAWYLMPDSVPRGPDSDHFYNEGPTRKEHQAALFLILLSFQVVSPWKVQCKPHFGNSHLSEVRRELVGFCEVDRWKLLLVSLFVRHTFFYCDFISTLSQLVNPFRFVYFCFTLS